MIQILDFIVPKATFTPNGRENTFLHFKFNKDNPSLWMRSRRSHSAKLHLSTFISLSYFKGSSVCFHVNVGETHSHILPTSLFAAIFLVTAVICNSLSTSTAAVWDTITLMCILQSVIFGTTRFGSDDIRVCFRLKLIKLSWWFLSDMITRYPTLWTEQVRSRQNNRTRSPCEFQRPLFL